MNGIARVSKTGLMALLCMLAFAASAFQAMAQDAHVHAHGAGSHGKSIDLGMSAAIDRQGRIWAVSKEAANDDQFVVLQTSTDMGKTWSDPRRLQKTPEPVAASGEARPHIAFGPKSEIYVTYTKPIAKPHIGEIRFMRSLDGGRTFSEPVTVHANRDVITHSFESMVVDRAGRIFVAWIDGRDGEQAKARQERYAGSAVYYAVSSDSGATFKGDYKIADHSCECCRIGLALDAKGNPVAMWRHVFAPNIRDHALSELAPDGKAAPATRVTFDDWRIDACPHHGPSVAYAADGTRHQVWFNGKEGAGGGALYAMATPAGALGAAVALGSEQATHPDVAVHGRQVAVAWTQFDGKSTAISARVSEDGGASWRAQELGRTSGESDKPYLVTSATGIVLIWRTRDEGIRIIPIGKAKI